MERHGIDEQTAFELLRSHSHRTGRKLIHVAEAVATSHLLLPGPTEPHSGDSQPPGTLAEGAPKPQPTG
jgi:ANTAR domain